MSKALKTQLVPQLQAVGFSGRFPDFRRHAESSIHFVSIRYDKAGTAFFLESGSHPRGDTLTPWGEIVPEDKLILEHVSFDLRARLQQHASRTSMPADWFTFDGFGENDELYAALATSVSTMLQQLEVWLAAGTPGPNVSVC